MFVAAMASFGQSVIFGQPSDDPNMNLQFLQFATQHATANPGDPQAQRQLAYWRDLVQRQQAQPQAPMPTPTSANPFAMPAMPPGAYGHAAPAAPSAAPASAPSLSHNMGPGTTGHAGSHDGSSERGAPPFLNRRATRAHIHMRKPSS